MRPAPSAHEIQHAILVLEAYANSDRADPSDVRLYSPLAQMAWSMMCGGSAYNDVLRCDALEAADMLRDGYLPGHDGWTSRIDYEAVL